MGFKTRLDCRLPPCLGQTAGKFVAYSDRDIDIKKRFEKLGTDPDINPVLVIGKDVRAHVAVPDDVYLSKKKAPHRKIQDSGEGAILPLSAGKEKESAPRVVPGSELLHPPEEKVFGSCWEM